MSTPATRQRPNILITGTPGTGKSTLAEQLADKFKFDFIEIGKIVKDFKIYTAYDEEYQSHVLDEEKLLDHIEDRMDSDSGGVVVDYHGSDFFPERWFDFVIVLRCANAILFDRLKARGYNDFKVRENVECEIFGSLLEEARDAYPEERIHELRSEGPTDLQKNIEKITELVRSWKQ
ncbi:hypothetical protein WR25_03527 [Diploscapter pachys]|uniref:Adenylate kinase isoenzyme 6 homolog n=1 Tax=Diploscapter pachys TaxID=2018661 RepID=A0A2A2JD11_9BILA|nr:hypothetical protein WR25_03527 [Diploscapter pachys]